VAGVGVDADEAGDLAGDAGLGMAQLSLSERLMSRIWPDSLVTTTLTEGTRLLALGALGSS
jgi:hypothetical protein